MRLGWPGITSIIGVASGSNTGTLKALIDQTIDDIASEFQWPELNRTWNFKLIKDQAAYPLPPDFDSHNNETWWNQGQRWPLIGPLTNQVWQQYKSGLITTLPRQRFRVSGIGNNTFEIDPTPTSTDDDQLAVFQYQSTVRRIPRPWGPNQGVVSGTDYRSNDGLILRCTGNGNTSGTGLKPEVGRDGTCIWESIPDYVASSIYYVGQYVFANSKVYKCTTSGLTTAASPSVTSGTQTIGTAVFEFISTPPAWAGGTEYTTESSYVVNSSSKAYRCLNSGVSGKFGPVFFETLQEGSYPPASPKTIIIPDGTAQWTLDYTYNSFLHDNDLLVLDESIITDEVVWKVLENLGFEYQEKKAASEAQKEIAKTKKLGASSTSFNQQDQWPWAIGIWSYPIQNFGIND
jgi:hypothetical protein